MTSTSIPRLTLGLPVYNCERYLAASLDALLRQTFTDFELIISDNDIEHLDGSFLVAQVKAAHEELEVLAARIRRGTSAYAHEVQGLLERVAREALDLGAARRELDMHGGRDARCGR